MTDQTLSTLMGLGWMLASAMVLAHIIGAVALDWSQYHPTYWVALALLVGMALANTVTYFSGVEHE